MALEPSAGGPESIKKAAEMLAGAKNPVLVSGELRKAAFRYCFGQTIRWKLINDESYIITRLDVRMCRYENLFNL